MTDKNRARELLALAERCETATGPDRELDIAILVAIDWREPDWEKGERAARELAERHGLAWLVSRSVDGYNSVWRHLPRLTASLDAAMTLVPDGWDWCAGTGRGRGWATLGLPSNAPSGSSDDEVSCDDAATPALALCAAALRAIAQTEVPNDR